MTLSRNLAELFTGTGIVTIMLISLGLMLIIIEFFQPAHRIPTYCGAALTVCGTAVRMFSGGTLVMLFFMVFGCVLILFLAHILMLLTQKRAWLTQSLALKLEHSINEDEIEGYAFLLGRTGVATTDIRESGHMTIDDVIFFVACDSFIAKGTPVRVVNVSGDSIMVSAANESGEEQN